MALNMADVDSPQSCLIPICNRKTYPGEVLADLTALDSKRGSKRGMQ